MEVCQRSGSRHATAATAHHMSLSAPTARNGARQVMLLAIARGDEREIGNLNFITAAANAMYNAIIENLQQEHCHLSKVHTVINLLTDTIRTSRYVEPTPVKSISRTRSPCSADGAGYRPLGLAGFTS